MHKLLCSLVILALVFFSQKELISQTTSSGWVSTIVGTGSDQVNDVKTDSEGNVYSIGSFSGTSNFSSTSPDNTLSTFGARDIFITKHSSDGQFLWVTRFGGAEDDQGFSLDVNENGEVYAVGLYEGNATFDPNTTLSNSGRQDIFISKLNADGSLNWVKRIGGESTDEANSVAIDKNGDIYVVGRFVGSVDFDPGAGSETLQSFGGPDAFILKLTGDGDYLWAFDLGTGGNEECEAVSVDNENNVVVTGIFDSTVDFDPGPEEVTLFGDGLSDPFYLKLTPEGSFIWVRSFTSSGFVFSADLEIDGDNNIIAHGFFRDDMNFDPVNSNVVTESIGAEDSFTAKLDPNGNLVWANILGGENIEFGYGVAVDAIGDVYVTGLYYDDPDFDPSDNVVSLPSINLEDTYIVKYDSQGNFVWVKRTGGTSSDSGYGIDISPTGDVIVGGNYWGTSDLDPEPNATLNTESADLADAFILKIDQLVSSVSNTVYDFDISITPNPSTDLISIKSNVQIPLNASLVNEMGIKVLDSFTLKSDKKTIDLKDLPNGIYYLILESDQGYSTKKIMKM